LANPTYRDSKNNEEYRKLPALSSGFSTNRAYWDGTGWNPEKITNATATHITIKPSAKILSVICFINAHH
jgi:hypothetical protein